MDPDALLIQPPEVDLADATVSAVVRETPAGRGWDVVVLITRRPNQPRLSASEVSVELRDADGRPLPLQDRDEGLLVEAGGGLGVTANARFRFAATGAAPARLDVTYKDFPLTFTVGG